MVSILIISQINVSLYINGNEKKTKLFIPLYSNHGHHKKIIKVDLNSVSEATLTPRNLHLRQLYIGNDLRGSDGFTDCFRQPSYKSRLC